MKNVRIYTVAELELPFLSPGAAQKTAPVQHQLLAPAPGVEKSRATHWWHDPAQMIEDETRAEVERLWDERLRTRFAS